MLPLRLTVENFMPYRGRQGPLVLEGVGIACLAGENGAGKSALLDAVTWALWGRSRAGASSDPLVAEGTAEMAVEMEFRVGEGRYRVLRRHRKARGGGRGGQSALELQAWDGTAYRSLTGTNTRETQGRLLEALRLDYDTFINTAFLVQGKADLFVTRPPAERKRLLGEILGLSLYDGLAARSREEAGERDLQRRTAALAGETLDRELATAPELRRELEEAAVTLAALRPRLQAAEQEREQTEAEAARMGQLEAERDRLQAETARLERETTRLEARRTDLTRRTTAAQSVMQRQAEIEAGYAALASARGALTEEGERARAFALLTAKRAPLEAAIREAATALERETAAIEAQAQALRRQIDQGASLEERQRELEGRRHGLDADWAAYAERGAEATRLVGEVEARRARILRLREEDQEVQQRLTSFNEGVTHDGHCPLCGSDLGAHGVEQVRQHYRERRREIAAEVEAITTEGRALQERRRALEAEVQQEEARLRRETAETDDALGRLRAEADRAATAATELGPLEERLAALRRQMEGGAFAVHERERLREIEAEAAALAYDPAAHDRASARVAELERWEEENRALAQALATLPQDAASLAETQEDTARVEGALAEAAARLAELEEELQAREEVRDRLRTAEAMSAELRLQVEATEREEARAQVRLEELERRRGERERLRSDERRATEEKSIYDELSAAFGVRGVQALLIETALPELEEEANALLSRITDNRMHLRLETQRETKAGTQQETLELIVGDEWGTRPYEMYSGGEAFRISFALRIALSKLLARRAGAEVPVLFIDEGFGSQDATGRDRLVEAIAALWEDPAFHDGLILAITHIDEIKNQFDVRIEVAKTERGSRFQVAS